MLREKKCNDQKNLNIGNIDTIKLKKIFCCHWSFQLDFQEDSGFQN
jgi:hypothetical protein